MNKGIRVELNDKQQKLYDDWLHHIKSLYGKHGSITWKITPTEIGDVIVVHSNLANVDLELTDIDSW
jgi:hypothetical protein